MKPSKWRRTDLRIQGSQQSRLHSHPIAALIKSTRRKNYSYWGEAKMTLCLMNILTRFTKYTCTLKQLDFSSDQLISKNHLCCMLTVNSYLKWTASLENSVLIDFISNLNWRLINLPFGTDCSKKMTLVLRFDWISFWEFWRFFIPRYNTKKVFLISAHL